MDNQDAVDEKCRFCHEGATEDFPLFYPCRCAGSIKYIHKQCLDKWLKHSSKLYCNICNEKYAYRTVYASSMPKTMPIVVTLKQMYAIISFPLRKSTSAAFVVLMWTMVFPYLLYWTLRALMATSGFIFWTTTDKTQIMAGQRFILSTSWKEWYENFFYNSTNDVVSFTGVYNDTNIPLGIMYTLVTLVLKPVLWILAQLTLNFLPESIQYDVIEIVFEFIVKATEGYPLLLIGVCAKPVALKVYTFILTQFSAETNRDLNKEKEDGEYIAIGVQMAPPEVVNAPAENNINGIAANELHRPYNVMEPIAEIENNNFEYDDVEDNSDNEDEVIDARIQAIQANINAVEERIQHIRNEIQAQQEPDALMVVDIAWIDDLGFFGVDRDTVKLYLKTLINAQFAIALFVWVPYIVGQTFIVTEFTSIIDGLESVYSIIWMFIEKGNKGTMSSSVIWMLGLHVTNLIVPQLEVFDFATLVIAVPIWMTISGVDVSFLSCVKMLNPLYHSGNVGKTNSKLLLQTNLSIVGIISKSWQIPIAIGYVIVLLLFCVVAACAPALTYTSRFTQKLRVIRKTINFTIVVAMSLLGIIICIGYIFHLSLAPLLSSSPLESIGNSLQKSHWHSLFCHIVVGCIYSCTFSHVLSVWRLGTRPGFMWYIKETNQTGYRLKDAALEHNPISYSKILAKTSLFIIALSTVSVTLPLLVITRITPVPLVINLNSWSYYLGHIEIILGLTLAVTLISTSAHISNAVKRMIICISNCVARSIGLTEYVTGQVNILDEGRWSIKQVPWLPIPLSSLCMPNNIVRNVFKQESIATFDMARVGIIKGSLPSDIYYKHMQQAINSALKSTYPSLAFTLYPNSMSVPGNHFMKIPQNRLVRVPVDGFGFPVDSIYDYEVADSPRQRQKAISEGYIIPYPAPHNETVDMRFKWMDYRVIYVPSMIEIRELVYMALTLFGMGMVVVTALTLALYIGGYILHPIYDDLKDTASPLYLGILVIFAIDVVGNYTMQTFAKTFTVREGLTKKLHIMLQRGLEISGAAFNVLVAIFLFVGVVPTLACTFIEIYSEALHWICHGNVHRVGVVSISLWDLIKRVWFMHMFAILLCAGISYMLSSVGWLNHVVSLLWQNPRKWPMQHIIRGYAIPAIVCLAAVTGLPVILGLLHSAYSNDLPVDHVRNVLLLNDMEVLAPNACLIVLATVVCFVAMKGLVLYRKSAGMVRERLYSLGRVLENIDGSDKPLLTHGPPK